MKKLIYLMIMLFTISGVWGQSITQSEEEVTAILSNSQIWQMESVSVNGNPMEQKGATKDLGFAFRKDNNTFDFIENGEVTAIGQWKYFPDKKWVALAIQQKVSLLIVSISQNEFVAVHPTQIEASEDDPRMEVIFKIK